MISQIKKEREEKNIEKNITTKLVNIKENGNKKNKDRTYTKEKNKKEKIINK